METVRFQRVYKEEQMAVGNDVTRWHLQHGKVWNVLQRRGDSFTPAGVFFLTMICGDGFFVHFDTKEGVKWSVSALQEAFRKGIYLLLELEADVVYAAIGEEKGSLCELAEHLGFFYVENGGFYRRGICEGGVHLFCLDKQEAYEKLRKRKTRKEKKNGFVSFPGYLEN